MRLAKRLVLFSTVVILGIAANANAQSSWTVQPTAFTDGGSVSGSFTYDASTNAFSNINLVTTSGSALPGATYTILFGDNNSELSLVTKTGDLTGTPTLVLYFNSPLTNAGGTVAFTAQEFTCYNAGCNSLTTPSRNTATNAGTVNGASIASASWWFWYVTSL